MRAGVNVTQASELAVGGDRARSNECVQFCGRSPEPGRCGAGDSRAQELVRLEGSEEPALVEAAPQTQSSWFAPSFRFRETAPAVPS